jgi:hypothetical protein
MHMSSGFAILWIPTRSSHVSPPGLAPGPRDLYLVTVVKPLVGVSGFGVSQCMDLLSPRFPILQIPIDDSLVGFFPMLPMAATCPRHRLRLWPPWYFLSLSGYRVSISSCKIILSSGSPIRRFPTLFGFLTRVLNDGRFRSTLEFRYFTKP